jgi:hypothetical protein
MGDDYFPKIPISSASHFSHFHIPHSLVKVRTVSNDRA